MNLLQVFVLVTVHNWLATATQVFYISPNTTTNISCPSRPCATLGQYLLDNNGTLPVVSNVEYYFLPGEHHVPANFILQYLNNFTLAGAASNESLSTVLVSSCYPSKYLLRVAHSLQVKIVNIAFRHCKLSKNITYLLLLNVTSLNFETIVFVGCGFQAYNLFGKFSIKNARFELHQPFPVTTAYMLGILIYYKDDFWDYAYSNNTMEITDTIITGEMFSGILLSLHQTKYNVSTKLSNLKFYYISRVTLHISINTLANVLMENCTFLYNQYTLSELSIDSMIMIVIEKFTFNPTIKFLNCIFHQNTDWQSLILIVTRNVQSHDNDTICPTKPNIIIQSCDFINNKSPLIDVLGDTTTFCMLNVMIIGPIFMIGNSFMYIYHFGVITIIKTAIKIFGPVLISHNSASNIILCQHCEMLFSNDIVFTSNECSDSVISIQSDTAYLKVMEFSNIKFKNNIFSNKLIVLQPIGHGNPYMFCGFQYVAPNNASVVFAHHYNITFTNNHQVNLGVKLQSFCHLLLEHCQPHLHHFTTHCRWITTSVFYGHDPGVINQQIIQTDQRHHTTICYCSNNVTNCSVDVLGPVYPGQVLQVDLCAPNSSEHSVLYVETHSTKLPNSACKIAHQTELVNTINNYSSAFTFTIVTDAKEICELFLTASPCIHSIYEVFSVKILPCPVGFTLQNGACNCDPFLKNVHIHTCYIDESTITRPASTWISAFNSSNGTIYLISPDCPVDYCIPHSSQLNLISPDLQCQFNRTGILCSQCHRPLSMVFGSSRCINCSNGHVLIAIIVIIAGILLVLLLYFLNLTVTSGTVSGIVFYANIISINDSVFLVNDKVLKPMRVFISFANLDLGIETCFYNGMDGYAKMFLQFFFPFYLIVIAVSIIVASRYSSRVLRWTYTRSLPVLATLFLLSYTSVLRAVSTVLFSYSTITQLSTGHQQLVWSIDASVPLFGLKFSILFITCIVLFLLLIPFNIILLFTRYLSKFRIINQFKPLLDAFQGSYKDKYYYWAGVYIILRSMFFSFYAFQTKLRLILTNIILILLISFFGYTHPNKSKMINIQELLLLLNLTIMYAVSYQGIDSVFSTVTNVMISLAFVQFCTIVLYHFITYTCRCNVVTALRTIKDKLMMHCSNTIDDGHQHVFNLALLDIPECTHNYSEYRDGLVSDDFENEQ